MKRYIRFYGLIALTLVLQSCGETALPDPDPKPVESFEIVISKAPYTALKTVGGSALVQDKRVLVARLSSGTWEAVSGYCPEDNTSRISFVASNNTFRCDKHNVVYDKDGKVTSGTSAPLTDYQVTYLANNANNDEVLTIYKISK